MRCSKARKYLSPYIDGELAGHENALLQSHLAGCDRCSRELDGIRHLQGLFSQAERFAAPLPFHAKVMEKAFIPRKTGFSLFPVLARFAEVGAFLAAIIAGIMSGGTLINAISPHHKGDQVVASLSLDSFEALPPDSLGRAYLATTEMRR